MSKMTKKQRKNFTAAEKAEAVRRHLVGKEAVSQICEELGIQPSAFYNWQQLLFARAESLFDSKPGRKKIDNSAAQVSELEARLSQKDSVIAELLQEHVDLKKSLGVNLKASGSRPIYGTRS